MTGNQLNKSLIRQEIRNRRSIHSPELKDVLDEKINTSLKQILNEKSIQKIHLFIPMENEINITSFIQYALDHNIDVYTSESLKHGRLRHWKLHSLTELQDGIYGTQFPMNSQIYEGTYDLIIIPGLAFTMQGDRVGYGAGYYDRFLIEHPKALKIGVAYSFQIYDELPVETFDIQLDKVVVGDC